jgi:plastocyanin
MTRRFVASVIAALAIVAIQLAPALAHDDPVGTPDVTISIGRGLSDRVVDVEPGAIVRFVNRDGERHRMRSRSGERGFDTGNIEPGESAQVRLTVAGTYTYLDDRERDDTRYHGRIVVGGTAGGGATAGVGPEPTPREGVTGPIPVRATVTIGDRVFEPASTTVAAGGTVTFRNEDGDEHTANGAGGIDSGTLASGATYEKRFTEAGTYDFLCAFHSDMRGTIEVIAPATAAAATPAPQTPAPTPSVATSPSPAAELVAPAAASTEGPASPADATISSDSSTSSTSPTDATISSEPAASQGALPGIALSVTLVGIASALFARLVRGTANRR